MEQLVIGIGREWYWVINKYLESTGGLHRVHHTKEKDTKEEREKWVREDMQGLRRETGRLTRFLTDLIFLQFIAV